MLLSLAPCLCWFLVLHSLFHDYQGLWKDKGSSSLHSTFLLQQAQSLGYHPLWYILPIYSFFLMNNMHIIRSIPQFSMVFAQKLRYNLCSWNPKRAFLLLGDSKYYLWRIYLLLLHFLGTDFSICLGNCYWFEYCHHNVVALWGTSSRCRDELVAFPSKARWSALNPFWHQSYLWTDC